MKTTIEYRQQQYSIDLSKPLDISLTLRGDDRNPIAWYLKSPRIEPVREGEWIGKVSQGSSTNFNNIYFNPHGHGTHTECVGHITPDCHSINVSLKTIWFPAKLITLEPHQ